MNQQIIIDIEETKDEDEDSITEEELEQAHRAAALASKMEKHIYHKQIAQK